MQNTASIHWLMRAFTQAADLTKKAWMEAYMRHQFHFIGVPAPTRKAIQKQWFKNLSLVTSSEEISELIHQLYAFNEREYHYTAIDLLSIKRRFLDDETIQTLLEMCITTNPWWDTVDFLATNIAGKWLYEREDLQRKIGHRWLQSTHLWLMRSALLFQLKYKEKTDFDLLSRYILSLSDHRNFFIQKAIGWALREYSKTEPAQVYTFVKENDNVLSNLAKREALKWIKRQNHRNDS